MSQKAIDKIKTEIDGDKANPYIKLIGDFLLQHLEQHPDAAGKILADGKTIKGSLEAMKKAAEKNKVGNMAMMTDAEGFAVVLEYFGIKGKPVGFTPVAAPDIQSDPDLTFNINLSL